MSRRRTAITAAAIAAALVVLAAVAVVVDVDVAAVPGRFRDAATAVSQAIVLAFFVAFLVLLARWILHTESGISVLPFDWAADAEEARRLATDLAAELEHIRAVHCASAPEILDIRLTNHPKAIGKGTEGLVLPTFASSHEPFEQVIADVGAVNVAGVQLQLGKFLVALRRLVPGRDRTVYLLASMERSTSGIRLRARLQGQSVGVVSSWMTVAPVSAAVAGGEGPEDDAIRDLAYEIAKDLDPSIGVRTGPALRHFTEALERLHAYSVTPDEEGLAKVRAAWERAHEKEPNCPSLGGLAYTMGIAYLNHGNDVEAEKMFRTATTMNAGDPRPWLGLGIARADLGWNLLARRAYKTALVLNPRSPHALNNLAELLRAEGRLDEGINECERALRIDGTFAYARLTLGNLYSAQADRFVRLGRHQDAAVHYERALEEYRRALHIDESKSLTERRPVAAYPAYAYACNATANVLAKQGRFREAVDHHRKAIALASDDWFFWHSLGDTRRLQGNAEGDPERRAERWRDALDALEHARPGRFAWTLHHLAELALVSGDPDAADSFFAEAVEIHATQFEMPGRGGNRRLEPTSRALGDRDAEVDCAFDALVHGCDRPDCHVYLGYAYAFTRRPDEASIVLRGALREYLDDTGPPRSAAGGGGRRTATGKPQGDPVLWHVLQGVKAWCDGDDKEARKQMESALERRDDGHSVDRRLGASGRRRMPPVVNATEPVLLKALARLVVGERARALELVRGVVPEHPPLPFQASTLWLGLLLHDGAPINGLDEMHHLLGHPVVDMPKQKRPFQAPDSRTSP